MAIEIRAYAEDYKTDWDLFVSQARNGMFLFQRGYMDYHADRFTDHSLLFFKEDGSLIALLPANKKGDTLESHGGLTYGGLICSSRTSAEDVLGCFEALVSYMGQSGIKTLYYKCMPHIFHRQPSEEDRYALFRMGAHRYRVDLSTTIDLSFPGYRVSKGKKTGRSRAKREGVEIRESQEFEQFFSIVEARLQERHGVKPVHSASEILKLQQLFPDNIKLYAAHYREEMVAGMVVYLSDRVCHSQYISSTPEGRDLRAVDYLTLELVEQMASSKRYFDFGISNTDQGRVLDSSLCRQKEEFGGRGVAHEFFRMEIQENPEWITKDVPLPE